MTPRERRFLEQYDGDVIKTAALAGYGARTALLMQLAVDAERTLRGRELIVEVEEGAFTDVANAGSGPPARPYR